MKPIKPGDVKFKPPQFEPNKESWWTESDTFGSGSFLATTPSAQWSPSLLQWPPTFTWFPWQNGLFDWSTLAQSKVTILTHCPVNKEFIDRCHHLAVRCFPYVSLYFGSETATFGNIVSPTYQGVKWADHDSWYARNSPQTDDTTPWEFGTA